MKINASADTSVWALPVGIDFYFNGFELLILCFALEFTWPHEYTGPQLWRA